MISGLNWQKMGCEIRRCSYKMFEKSILKGSSGKVVDSKELGYQWDCR